MFGLRMVLRNTGNSKYACLCKCTVIHKSTIKIKKKLLVDI